MSFLRSDELLKRTGTAEYYYACKDEYQDERCKRLAEKLTDSHCHVYSGRIAGRAVNATDSFYEGLSPCPYDGTAGMLLEVGQRQGISHYVVHSVATKPEQVSSINAWFSKAEEKPSAKDRLLPGRHQPPLF